MRRRFNFPFLIIGLTVLIQGAGCGSKAKTTGVYPARGSVLVKGEPAEYANVILTPVEADSKKRKAYGVVGADGNFQLSTELQFDGAEPGEYFVTVSWRKPKNPKISDSDDGPELLPKNYQDPQKSGLKVVIEARDNQMKPFELTAKS